MEHFFAALGIGALAVAVLFLVGGMLTEGYTRPEKLLVNLAGLLVLLGLAYTIGCLIILLLKLPV